MADLALLGVLGRETQCCTKGWKGDYSAPGLHVSTCVLLSFMWQSHICQRACVSPGARSSDQPLVLLVEGTVWKAVGLKGTFQMSIWSIKSCKGG
jgi:hypothetical protein